MEGAPTAKKQKISEFFQPKTSEKASQPILPQAPSKDEDELSPEQIAKIEQNKLNALERKRKLEQERSQTVNSQSTVKTSEKQEEAISPSSGSIMSYLTEPGWNSVLADEFKKKYFKDILQFLENEKKSGQQVFPPENEIFNAFNFTPFDKIKVDPYHDVGQAHGLCFSVKKGVKPPPSLKNIYKELATDIKGFVQPNHGNLEKWAHEGVLLLNATLTVRAHTANSHADCGWQQFTDAVIKIINEKKKGIVFILWGGFAQKKCSSINSKKHHIIKAAHPSPLSANKFFGCKVFSQTNSLLEKDGLKPIDWNLPKTI